MTTRSPSVSATRWRRSGSASMASRGTSRSVCSAAEPPQVQNARMTSRGNRRFATGSAAVLALTLGLSGCGGEKKEKAEPTVKPTVTAGVTLTPSGTKLKFGEAATMAWSPDQKAKGIVSVAVEKVLEGTAKDVARIRITPKPEHPRLYYVTV